MKKKYRGFSLIEAMITLAIIGAAVVVVLVYQSQAESTARVTNTVFAVANMNAKIKAYYAAAGSYNDLTTTQVNKMGLVTQPLTWNGTYSIIQDAWGNAMNVVGNAASATPTFVITIGGGLLSPFPGTPVPIPLSNEECVSLATQLANGADVINVGTASAITTNNGLVGGGKVYKAAGNVLSMANLTDAAGCGTANPKIALQFH